MQVDTLITGAAVITMDEDRRILRDGVIAVQGDRIVAVGPSEELARRYTADTTVSGEGFLATPGLVNGHAHITETLIRGFLPEDLPFDEELMEWVIPLYKGHDEAEQSLSAQLAVVAMLRTGTTTFIEAGTVIALDAVMEAIAPIGIRGRVGRWCEDRAWDRAADQTGMTETACAALDADCARWPDDGRRLSVWPNLIGHSTGTDALWQHASALAQREGLGVSAHMSPVLDDPAWYLEHEGKRPIVHLSEIGVLGPWLNLVHMVQIDEAELALVAASGTNVTHCPGAAIKCGFGTTRDGLFPEMDAAGVNLVLGTDGADSHDMVRAMALMAGLFKDGRKDRGLFPAAKVLEMATINGARALGLGETIGRLAPGYKADIVLHALDRPEWRPLNNPVNQLVWSASGASVHSVWVDGERVVEAYRCTKIDEGALYARAQVAAQQILSRSGLPAHGAWSAA
ncbi:amidohydrolase family protein [Novosphingobium aquimarinum]|uniref:amidohydrolase family protein n=1 Tax=Novosphingobium aquimarinum TaxID=2682494 RepID=UPI0012ECB2E9|nr:amidohydrolase family protein [Novosphingobium aquimarinum]